MYISCIIIILFLKVIFLSVIGSLISYAETGTIDTVYYFKPGEGQNVGQGSEYFPMNIFGLPDTNASENIPSQSPYQVCSLGFDGEIIIGFKDYVVYDGEGTDFTIFENAFENPVTKKNFAEPGKVAVSQDGINYIEFPFDSLTLVGCAGKTPTNGKNDPFNPSESGGDSFDISDVGLQYIKYIKITDISRMVLDNPNHPYYDPIITGFDLDAVVGLNLQKDNTLDVNSTDKSNIELIQNYSGILIKTDNSYPGIFKVKILALQGKVVFDSVFQDFILIDRNLFIRGWYIVSISCGNFSIFKMLIL